MRRAWLFGTGYAGVVLCSFIVLFTLIRKWNIPPETRYETKVVVPVIDRSILKARQRIFVSRTLRHDNVKSDQLVIFPICDSANKWGYITVDGNIIMPTQFEEVGKFVSDGLLAVKINGLWGYMDEHGAMAIAPQYKDAKTFSEGLAVVSNVNDGYNDLYAAIDTKGEIVIQPQFINFYSFVDGVAWVLEKSDINNVGVVNLTGGIVLPYGKYGNTETYIHWFAEGKCFVRTGRYDPMGRDSSPNCYFVDATGKVIISNDNIESATFFDHDVCFVRVEGKWGLIDSTGKWIVNPKYTACYSVNDDFRSISRYCDVAPTRSRARHIGKYEELPYIYSFVEDLALVEKDGRFGYLDYHGKEIIKPKYENADFFSEGLAAVKVKGKYGYIDKTNKIVIKPKFDRASYFNEGLAPVKINNKYGCINKQGKIIISPRYGYLDIFRNGLAIFFQGQKWGYINHAGKEVWSGKIVKNDDSD